jgi:hypothetical protein
LKLHPKDEPERRHPTGALDFSRSPPLPEETPGFTTNPQRSVPMLANPFRPSAATRNRALRKSPARAAGRAEDRPRQCAGEPVQRQVQQIAPSGHPSAVTIKLGWQNG